MLLVIVSSARAERYQNPSSGSKNAATFSVDGDAILRTMRIHDINGKPDPKGTNGLLGSSKTVRLKRGMHRIRFHYAMGENYTFKTIKFYVTAGQKYTLRARHDKKMTTSSTFLSQIKGASR